MKRHELKIVIVGRNGQVAWELRQALASMGSFSCVTHPGFDLTYLDSLGTGIRGLRPDQW